MRTVVLLLLLVVLDAARVLMRLEVADDEGTLAGSDLDRDMSSVVLLLLMLLFPRTPVLLNERFWLRVLVARIAGSVSPPTPSPPPPPSPREVVERMVFERSVCNCRWCGLAEDVIVCTEMRRTSKGRFSLRVWLCACVCVCV